MLPPSEWVLSHTPLTPHLSCASGQLSSRVPSAWNPLLTGVCSSQILSPERVLPCPSSVAPHPSLTLVPRHFLRTSFTFKALIAVWCYAHAFICMCVFPSFIQSSAAEEQWFWKSCSVCTSSSWKPVWHRVGTHMTANWIMSEYTPTYTYHLEILSKLRRKS